MESTLAASTAAGDQPRSTRHPPGYIESREALRRLPLILDRANAEERTAFVLRVIEGMPLEDVATTLDVSVATAKRRLSWASGAKGPRSRDSLKSDHHGWRVAHGLGVRACRIHARAFVGAAAPYEGA